MNTKFGNFKELKHFHYISKLLSIKGVATDKTIPIPTPAPAPLLEDTSDLGGHDWSELPGSHVAGYVE